MPLNHKLRKFTAGYKLSRSQEKINHLMYMDDIKIFAKMKKNWKLWRPDSIINHKKREFAKLSTLMSRLTTEYVKLKNVKRGISTSTLQLKTLWNMKVKIIPIVIGSFGTVTKGFLKGLEDLEVGERVETIQTALLRTAKILSRVLETWGDLLSLKTQWKTIS